MVTIRDYLINDHQRCDEFLEIAENCVGQGDWEGARNAFHRFHRAIERHLAIEERVVFTAFEKEIGDAATPASMLRREHQQIRGIVSRMRAALTASDAIDFLIHFETYFILMRQHSLKEEEMLYPLMDHLLGDKRRAIIDAMHAIDEIEVET